MRHLVLTAATVLSILDAVLWGVSIAAVCTPLVSLMVLVVMLAAAAMMGVIAVLLWVARAICRHAGSPGRDDVPDRDDAYLNVIDRLTVRCAREGRRHLSQVD